MKTLIDQLFVIYDSALTPFKHLTNDDDGQGEIEDRLEKIQRGESIDLFHEDDFDRKFGDQQLRSKLEELKQEWLVQRGTDLPEILWRTRTELHLAFKNPNILTIYRAKLDLDDIKEKLIKELALPPEQVVLKFDKQRQRATRPELKDKFAELKKSYEFTKQIFDCQPISIEDLLQMFPELEQDAFRKRIVTANKRLSDIHVKIQKQGSAYAIVTLP